MADNPSTYGLYRETADDGTIVTSIEPVNTRGRKMNLDEQVAIAQGWNQNDSEHPVFPNHWYPPGDDVRLSDLQLAPPAYSTDIAAAWELIPEHDQVMLVRDPNTNRWDAVFVITTGTGDELPEAICRAFLATQGEE